MCNPWLDSENLVPGQNWKTEIERAIEDSTYFMALLSSNSVSKKGFVQKELKTALDLLDNFPSSEVFVIPVRVDDCEQADGKLQNLHWVNLFPSYYTGFNEILSVLKTGKKKTSHLHF